MNNICEICGRPLDRSRGLDIICMEDGVVHTVDEACYHLMSTCTLCEHNKGCRFEHDDTVTEPKITTRSINQNGMNIVMQVPNPVRIEKTCKENCVCFWTDFGCLRQNNGQGCPNVLFKWKGVSQNET